MAKRKAQQDPAVDQPDNDKIKDLEQFMEDSSGALMNTNTGVKINDDQNSLKAGERGASLLEDFILREKITHFDHERIPERVVHARGSGAHGVFKLYEPLPEYTKAQFLNDTSIETPVFVRFSTVAGSRGSTDLARDVRGFAVKFYTQEGNFDLVGNNMPVFFIQDAMKFPDLVHAVKPEPDNEIPQAASAHDTFWDFISVMPESTHMIMWLMSDRAIPRSYRMMEGFGVHTFRLVNAEGKSCFVKFHWKPLLGVHSVAWDEAQNISGKDPDFHRRDLWDAIESGNFPEWELGLQIVPEEDEFKFDFDLLDPTKIIPEELVPVRRVGKLTLNRNPENFFAETEQAAFHIGHVVPGIDFTNDPLLQGRLFSYTDTQLIRLGGPNFQEIPINRPIVPVHNNQRDGFMRQTINRGKVSYGPNSIGDNFPLQAKVSEGGFASYPERIDARKVRARSKSFLDHFSQAKLFFNSQSEPEKNHMIDAFSFELGKVQSNAVRQRMLGILSLVDKRLASEVGFALRLAIPEIPEQPMNRSIPADADPADYEPVVKKPSVAASPALSMATSPKNSIQTRKIAFIAADGVDGKSLNTVKAALENAGAIVEVVAPRQNFILSETDKEVPVNHSLLTAASVFYDGVYVPGGADSVATIAADADAVHFLNEAFKHCKAIAADSAAIPVIEATYFAKQVPAECTDESVLLDGIVVGDKPSTLADRFILALAQHRFWEREKPRKVPA
ncbi:catalase [Dyadobacter sp. BE34]|uniref:Catalase n=1 Tax=Dyadobacter fermentans TaxID=94254 RepID=A0ABU1QTL1_9BACT|nr:MULTISPECIES: catalase [Dyadobacter]MDR6804506.1 catalase [Dyadobacter fermentans]MDR7042246.1 catalase [Dyadobacter sp. BE242]MDR7196648.1 catalase [Dyadobacter sp. BE34]MDR7212806.1 catalase [Dyadobacter sp. BE31]MDR7262055.1 catalase [Dyadobacter sp. BE32]